MVEKREENLEEGNIRSARRRAPKKNYNRNKEIIKEEKVTIRKKRK